MRGIALLLLLGACSEPARTCHVTAQPEGSARLDCPGSPSVQLPGSCRLVADVSPPVLRCPGQPDRTLDAPCEVASDQVLECAGVAIELPAAAGSLAGRVSLQGADASEATVSIVGRSVHPAPDGGYRIDRLPSGTFPLTIEAPCCWAQTLPEVTVRPGLREVAAMSLERVRRLAPGRGSLAGVSPGGKLLVFADGAGVVDLATGDVRWYEMDGYRPDVAASGRIVLDGWSVLDTETGEVTLVDRGGPGHRATGHFTEDGRCLGIDDPALPGRTVVYELPSPDPLVLDGTVLGAGARGLLIQSGGSLVYRTCSGEVRTIAQDVDATHAAVDGVTDQAVVPGGELLLFVDLRDLSVRALPGDMAYYPTFSAGGVAVRSRSAMLLWPRGAAEAFSAGAYTVSGPSPAFSPDGDTLVFQRPRVGETDVLVAASLTTGAVVEVGTSPARAPGRSFAADGTLVFLGTDGRLRLWRPAWDGPRAFGEGVVTFDLGEGRVAFTGAGGVQIVDLATMAVSGPLPAASDVLLGPGDELLVLHDADTSRIVDAETAAVLVTVPGRAMPAGRGALFIDGERALHVWERGGTVALAGPTVPYLEAQLARHGLVNGYDGEGSFIYQVRLP